MTTRRIVAIALIVVAFAMPLAVYAVAVLEVAGR